MCKWGFAGASDSSRQPRRKVSAYFESAFCKKGIPKETGMPFEFLTFSLARLY